MSLMEDLGEIDEYYGVRKHANPPPFLVKTYMLVEDPATDTVVSWNSDGTAFVVWQPAEFARDLLPTLFKHSNFSSFIRQLNTYGFRKVATSRWEFCNDKFQKGKRELLSHIRRRKAWAATRSARRSPAAASPPPPSTASEVETGRPRSLSSGASSNSSSEQNNITIAEENKRLKRENGMLTSELSSARSKCKELMDLVAAYTTSSTLSSSVAVPKGGDGDRRVKLFGVRLDSAIKGEYDQDDDEQGPEKKRKATGTGSDSRFLHLHQSCNY